jgi:hypothetical protein
MRDGSVVEVAVAAEVDALRSRSAILPTMFLGWLSIVPQ